MTVPAKGPVNETAAVQAFIKARQGTLLVLAAATVRECPNDELAREVHRLIGTLGAYQLTNAVAVVRRLEIVCLNPGSSLDDINECRSDTAAVLAEMADAAPRSAHEDTT